MLNIFNLTFIIPLQSLAAGGRSAWPTTLAALSILFLLVLLFTTLKPLKNGFKDVYGYYRTRSRLLDKVLAIILTFIIFFPPLAFAGEEPWSVVVLELSILLLFFIFILKSAKSGIIEYRKNILNALFVLFISVIIFQLSFRTTKLPYRTFLGLKLVLLYFALFIVITNFVRRRVEIDNIIFGITLVGLFISLVGILQLVTGTGKVYWIREVKSLIFFSTFTYGNQFACYISIVALLTLGSLSTKILKGKEISWNLPPKQIFSDILDNILDKKVFFLFFSFIIMVMALFLSKSRGGILCFLIAAIFFVSSILLSRRHSKKVIPVLFLGIFVISLLLSFVFLALAFIGLEINIGVGKILEELHTIFSPGTHALRVSLYAAVPKIFKSSPFFGIGLGSLCEILPLYISKVPMHGWGFTEGVLEIAVISRHIFNDILTLLIEVGILGFLILLIPFSIFLIRLVTKIKKASSEYKYLIGMGILSALLFLGLHTLIDFDMELSSISSLFTILLSISLLVRNLSPAKNDSEIEMEAKRIITLKTKKTKLLFYLLSGVIFIYFAFIVSKPLLVGILIKGDPTFSSFNRALALEAGGDGLHYRYHKFILDQYKKDYITKEIAYNKAKDAIDKAIELNPYKTSYITAKGSLELLQGNYEEVSRLFGKASLMEPNNPIIQMGYAVVIFWQAIEEKDTHKKDVLLKKGLNQYSRARSLSEKVALRSIIKNKDTLSFLIESLRKEGIDIH